MKTQKSKLKIHNSVVKLIGVTKRYTIHHEKPTLVEKFINGRNESFLALRDINFDVKRGEKIGLIGPNGSGKTTLLKLITGITAPTWGTVIVNGRVVSLIDLEAGFHPELTGEQNIFLNGMLLNMDKKEIKSKLKKIIAFANINRFIDAPMYTYSEGMKLRLGFSVISHTKPDILILDENIAIGDQDFREKAYKKITEFVDRGTTVLIASHWLEFIQASCDRVIWLKDGQIEKDGKPSSVIKEYLRK